MIRNVIIALLAGLIMAAGAFWAWTIIHREKASPETNPGGVASLYQRTLTAVPVTSDTSDSLKAEGQAHGERARKLAELLKEPLSGPSATPPSTDVTPPASPSRPFSQTPAVPPINRPLSVVRSHAIPAAPPPAIAAKGSERQPAASNPRAFSVFESHENGPGDQASVTPVQQTSPEVIATSAGAVILLPTTVSSAPPDLLTEARVAKFARDIRFLSTVRTYVVSPRGTAAMASASRTRQLLLDNGIPPERANIIYAEPGSNLASLFGQHVGIVVDGAEGFADQLQRVIVRTMNEPNERRDQAAAAH